MDTLLCPLGRQRRRLLGAAGALGALATLGLTGCSREPAGAAAGQRFNGQTMGSGYTVRLAGAALPDARLQGLQADVQAALDAVDQRMSLYQPDSELRRFNAHALDTPFEMSEDLMRVMHRAQQVAALSEGAFDVTVAPLVLAWGFGPEARQGVPDAAVRAELQTRTGWHRLKLDPAQRLAHKTLPALQADLGGIAKGYGVDRAALVLQAAGIEHFMVEVGGEVRTAGLNSQGRPWQIGIEEPDATPQRARLVLPLSGRAMATSGDYRNWFQEGTRRYSHEIDPRSAEPISHGLASVTVVADDCMQADAWATALIVMGLQRGLALAQDQGLAAHFILRGTDGRLTDHSSPAFATLQPPPVA